MKIEKKELLFQLQNCDSVTEIAKRLGVTPRGLRKRIQENPDLQAAQTEARERLVDVAQSKLGDAVRKGDAWAVKFVLETWGKSRGFSRLIQVDSNDKPGVMHLYFPDDGRDKPDPSNVIENVTQVVSDAVATN